MHPFPPGRALVAIDRGGPHRPSGLGVFSVIAIFFHFPIIFLAQWSWLIEARIMASIMLFWIVEDYLWFVINLAFGWRRFRPELVAWHRHWALGAPVDYWLFAALSAALFWISY